MKVTEGRYWSKKGSKRMTSSPCSRKATNTEYWPGWGRAVGEGRIGYVRGLTFVGAAGDEDFRFDVEAPAEVGVVVVLEGFSETKPALWVGIVIGGD